MKRIYYFLTLLMLASTPLALTSCDPDDGPWDDPWYDDWRNDNGYDNSVSTDVAMAQTLNGSWTGTVENESYDNSGQYVKTKCYVDFSFVQYTANSNNGNGYETDYVPAYDDKGNPVVDDNGKQVYDSQTLKFNWNFDSRTYMLYLTYESGMRFVIDTDPQKKEFFLGYDKSEDWDFFEAVMKEVGGKERATIMCSRVTENASPRRNAAKANGNVANAAKLAFGSMLTTQQGTGDVPFALHKR